jgi:signal transduction histidine kinase
MNRLSTREKLFLPVVLLFIIFAVFFVVFQQSREKEFKINTLNLRLQDYNDQMAEAITYMGSMDEAHLSAFVAMHKMPALRATVIKTNGKVIFDSQRKDYKNIENHSNRVEFRKAITQGEGYDISRSSKTTGERYFYSASYYPKEKIVIRSALPYNDNLYKRLRTDQHYIWIAIAVTILLMIVLYRFMNRLGTNITNLRRFAEKAEHDDDLNTDELAEFPDDELGETSEHIVKLFMKLKHTRQEQSILKRQLTQNAAHELKTPVASIQGYLETIITNPNITEEQKKIFLERCYAQSQRLTSLLHDISTLNRLDDAPDVRNFQDVDVSAIMQSIEREVGLQLQENGMTIVDNLPEKLIKRGNQSLIYSIFRNLVDNSIAYAGKGTTIDVSYDGSHFTFMDNGVGVGEEHLTRIFERFYRVDKGRSRKLGGTGLGLAIVKNAVLLHGGTISASINEPHGLRFDFTL